ncbi:hypothetical protein SRHO_G00245250 [Serrasalmus rhombeus]
MSVLLDHAFIFNARGGGGLLTFIWRISNTRRHHIGSRIQKRDIWLKTRDLTLASQFVSALRLGHRR